MSKLEKFFKQLAGIRIIQHFLFWLLSFRVLLEIFSSSSNPARIDYIYTSVFLITIMIPVYLNLYIIIPGLLSKKRYIAYSFSFAILIIAFAGFNQLTFNSLIDFVFPEYYFISYYAYFDVMKFFIVFLFLTTLLKLSKAWFHVSETKQMLTESERQKIENELMALKSQVNPHFMFNSLNNIYSLSLKNSEKTPEAIVKLGDILRYVIYEAQNDKVSLDKEIKLINDYIDLERLRTRYSEIEFVVKNIENKMEIAPLLFLPLIENGFKHGIRGDKKGYFKMLMKQEGKKLHFIAENNRGKVDDVEKADIKGIGIQNVKRRLEISYPGRHSFKIHEDESKFRVEMSFQTDIKNS